MVNKNKLTTKQLIILQYLYRFRFLTSAHVQKLQNDKTLRLTNYHLKILTEQNYISKHYTRTLGMANQPAVYYLASGSVKFLQEAIGLTAQSIKRIYREKTRSQQFISHSLYIAQYYLSLLDDSQKTGYTLKFFTKTDLLAHPYIIHPLPDGYFARVDTNSETKRYFLDVFDDSAPRFTLRKRIKQYSDYVEDGKFESVTKHTFPMLLFICPSIGILIYLKRHLARIYEETSLDQVSIYLATRENAFSGQWEKVEASKE